MPPNRDAGAWEWLSPHALLICATRDPVLSLEMPGFVPWLGAGLLVSTVLAAATAAWFVSRYGRRAGESAGAGRYAWLRGAIAQVPTRWYPAVGKHRPTTQLGAIAWLAMRQALPMCLAGLAIGLVLSVLIMSLEPTFYQHDVFKEATRIFSIVIAMVGVLWASIVGVGSVAEELDGRCGDFWRTRPIPFWWLFSVKFLVGLAAVAIVLDGAALVASWLGGSSAGWDWAYVACLLPFHAAMFAIAVALACWLRRVAIGAMAAVVGYAVFEVLSGMSTALRHHTPLDLYSRFERDHRDGLPIDLTKNGYPTMALVLVLIVVVSFVVAGRTLARYQPRRQMD